MPTYRYECVCGVRFDKFQKISERSVAECPRCGEEARQIMTAPAGLSGLSTPGPGSYDKTQDKVFDKEWDELWKDDPFVEEK